MPGRTAESYDRKVRPQRRFREVRPAPVCFAEQRCHARVDQVALAFERGQVAGVVSEASRPVRDRPLTRRPGDRGGQLGQLRLEARQRQGGRVRQPPNVVGRAGRCFPRVMVGAYLAIAAQQQISEDLFRSLVAGDGPGDHIGWPHAVAFEERVQLRQGVDVLEGGVLAGVELPLVVAFSVDADQQGGGGHRSWSESPSVTCQDDVFS